MAEPGSISRIAAALAPSPIRRMAAYLARPDVISLAGGVPDPRTFPIAEIEEAMAAVVAASPGEALQYGRTRGSPRLLEALGRELQPLGLPVSSHGLFVTTGSQQGLDLVGRLLCDPGDALILETPTYVGALSAFRAAGARLFGLGSGGSDPDPADLERAVGRAHEQGAKAKALYLCPNFQNPGGTTLSATARRELLARATDLGLWLVEDDPYRDLWFEAPPPPPIASLAGGDRVLYLGSFSKVLAPGLRLGYLLVPAPLATGLERLKEATDLCSSTLSQAIAAELLERGVIAKRLPAARALYRGRRDALLEALEKSFPRAATWTHPQGGFFSWVEMPGVDTEALLTPALAAQMAFVPGAAFFAEGGGSDTLRLAFSKEPEERIEEGIRRLKAALESTGSGL